MLICTTKLALSLARPSFPRKSGECGATQAWFREHHEWDLHLTELEIPHSSAWFGKSLGELALRSKFGCFVVGVVRQGYPIANLGPDTALFPSDTLLLLGTRDRAQKVRRYLDTAEIDENKADILDEIRLESIEVAAGSRLVDQSLGELEIPRYSGGTNRRRRTWGSPDPSSWTVPNLTGW